MQKITCEKVEITFGKPKLDCPKCNGTGFVNDLHCACKMIFGKKTQIETLAIVEQQPNGDIVVDLQEVQ